MVASKLDFFSTAVGSRVSDVLLTAYYAPLYPLLTYLMKFVSSNESSFADSAVASIFSKLFRTGSKTVSPTSATLFYTGDLFALYCLSLSTFF